MRVEPSRIPAIKIFEAKSFSDERGFLLQSWVGRDLTSLGIPSEFKQAIQTMSLRGAVRGLHFQWEPPMGKLVRCVQGAVLDVVVDVRIDSSTLGAHIAVELNSRSHRVIWVPPGFAHGTFALEDGSLVLYECSAEHGPGREGGIRWNDPALEIEWPGIPPIVSSKDAEAPLLAEWLETPNAQKFRCH